MEASSLPATELIVRTIADTAIANEAYFCQLDSVVGDGDFGYSLARGFEKVLDEFATFDRSSIGAFLKKTGMVIASRVGGTSGPLWGTAFLRAGGAAAGKTVLSPAEVIAILRAAVKGIQDRGGASLGEKTLLDALVPAIDRLEAGLAAEPSDGGVEALAGMAEAAELAAQATAALMAKRGRASYTGERSIGSPDAGAVAIAVIAKNVSAAWRAFVRT
jgi:phosphoenolpyruvate---glycerone phosphotransferase subunit DhaL